MRASADNWRPDDDGDWPKTVVSPSTGNEGNGAGAERMETGRPELTLFLPY